MSKNRYEALLVLDTQGKEDTVKDTIERLEKEFVKEGAVIDHIQKMDKRTFSYASGKLDSGYYVNYVFQAPVGTIEKLKAKFDLDDSVYRQYYGKVRVAKIAKVEKAKKKAAAAAAK